MIGGSPLTLFYVVRSALARIAESQAYFTVLLVHRQMRDDEACKKKWVASRWRTLTRAGTAPTGTATASWCRRVSCQACTERGGVVDSVAELRL